MCQKHEDFHQGALCPAYAAGFGRTSGLEQIVAILNKTDILQTNRGFQGGYKLAKEPAQYTVGSILRQTEGSLSPVACLEQDPINCSRHSCCATLPVWQGLEQVINEYLDSITLQDILQQLEQSK